MKVKKYVILFIYCVSWTLVYASKQWSLESEDNQAYDAVTFLAKYNDDKFDLSSQAEEKNHNSQLEELRELTKKIEALNQKIIESLEMARDFCATERERELVALTYHITENNI